MKLNLFKEPMVPLRALPLNPTGKKEVLKEPWFL